MRKIFTFAFAVGILSVMTGCQAKASEAASDNASATSSDSSAAPVAANKADAGIPAGAKAIIEAYPDQKFTYKNNAIVFADGSSIVYDDKKQKDYTHKMEGGDIEDMFSFKYDQGSRPAKQADGGRCRCEAFFKKMYGGTKEAVMKNLVTIDWFGQKLKVSKVNHVDKQLEAVAKEIAQHPDLVKKYMPQSSTWLWRPVRGTKNRLSAHSYGVTMDVCTKYTNYWLWSNPGKKETATDLKYENKIPLELVKIFEKYGFIWGGHWYHYDTMHFEYRPEILIYHGQKPIIVE